jgi:hypothetical protein
MERAFGPSANAVYRLTAAKGATHTSLGQRPRKGNGCSVGLKARSIAGFETASPDPPGRRKQNIKIGNPGLGKLAAASDPNLNSFP